MKLDRKNVRGFCQFRNSEVYGYRVAKPVPFANARVRVSQVSRRYTVEGNKQIVIGLLRYEIAGRGRTIQDHRSQVPAVGRFQIVYERLKLLSHKVLPVSA